MLTLVSGGQEELDLDVILDDPDTPPLAAGPLVALVARRGGPRRAFAAEADEKAYLRAAERGTVDTGLADRLAFALGLHPVFVWGRAW